MRTISHITSLFCLLVLVILGGCGGGGSSTPAPAPATNTTATKSTVKLSTTGTLPAGAQLSGIGVKIELPAGVTVDTVGTDVAAGVVTVTGAPAQAGATALTAPVYTPAAGNVPGTLQFAIGANNFGTGEFATVIFNLAAGASAPTPADVTITPADQTLHPVTTLSVVFI